MVCNPKSRIEHKDKTYEKEIKKCRGCMVCNPKSRIEHKDKTYEKEIKNVGVAWYATQKAENRT